jgi:hypothetical protein
MALASTASTIHTGGGHLIFSSSGRSTQSSLGSSVEYGPGAGSWVPVHPKIRGITFQAILTGSSVGAPVSGTFGIQASNDGVNVISSTLGTIAFSSASGHVSPVSDGFAIDAHYNFVRAYLSTVAGSMSTGSTGQVVASPHNVGGW